MPDSSTVVLMMPPMLVVVLIADGMDVTVIRQEQTEDIWVLKRGQNGPKPRGALVCVLRSEHTLDIVLGCVLKAV